MGGVRKVKECVTCGNVKSIEAKGLCSTCYRKARQAEDPTFKNKDRHVLGTCVTCQRTITICARGMCGRCYTRARMEEDPEYAAQRTAKQKKWNKESRVRKSRAQNNDRISPPKRRPIIRPEAEFMPDVFCSVCDRSMNRFDYTVDCDGLQAHGVCALVKGDRIGWKKPPYREVV